MQTLKLYSFDLDVKNEDKALDLLDYWDDYLKEKKANEERAKRQLQQSLLLSPLSMILPPPSPSSTPPHSPHSSSSLSSPSLYHTPSSLSSSSSTSSLSSAVLSTPTKKHKRQRAAKRVIAQDETTNGEVEKLQKQVRDAHQHSIQLKIDLEKTNLEKRSLLLRVSDSKSQIDQQKLELDIYRKRFRKMRPDAPLPTLSSLSSFPLPSFPLSLFDVANRTVIAADEEKNYLPDDVADLISNSFDTFHLFQTNEEMEKLIDISSSKLADLKARDHRSLDLLLNLNSFFSSPSSSSFPFPDLSFHPSSDQSNNRTTPDQLLGDSENNNDDNNNNDNNGGTEVKNKKEEEGEEEEVRNIINGGDDNDKSNADENQSSDQLLLSNEFESDQTNQEITPKESQ